MVLGLKEYQIFELLSHENPEEMSADFWTQISQETTITEKLIASGYLEYLNWDVIKIDENFSEDFIKKYADRINFKIADIKIIDPETILEVSKYAQMEDLLKIANLPNSFMQEHLDELSELEEFYLNQSLTSSFLKKNASIINWTLFSRNYPIDAELFKDKEIRSHIDYKELSFNDNAIIITSDFVEEYEDELDWNGISARVDLITEEYFLEDYADKISWDVVYKQKDKLPEELVKKFNKELEKGKKLSEKAEKRKAKEYKTASEMAADKNPNISKFSFFMTTLLADTLDDVPWKKLSNGKLTFSFVKNHLEKNQLDINDVLKNNNYKDSKLKLLPWSELSARITDTDLVIKHHNLIDFTQLNYDKIDLSRIPANILLSHIDKINMDSFAQSPSLTEDVVNKMISLAVEHKNNKGFVLFEHSNEFLHKFDFTKFISTHEVSDEFIRKNLNRINWTELSTQITPEQAEKFTNQVHWQIIIDGKNANFTDLKSVKQEHAPEYSAEQIRNYYIKQKERYNTYNASIIEEAFRIGDVNLMPILNPDFSEKQLNVLINALRHNVDILHINNPEYSVEKMENLIESQIAGIDISQYDDKTSTDRILEDRYAFITGTTIKVNPELDVFYQAGYSSKQAAELNELKLADAKEILEEDFREYSPEKIHFITEIFKYNQGEMSKKVDARKLIDLDQILSRDYLTSQDLKLMLISHQAYLKDPVNVQLIGIAELAKYNEAQRKNAIKAFELNLPLECLTRGTDKEVELYLESIESHRQKSRKLKNAVQQIGIGAKNTLKSFITKFTLSPDEIDESKEETSETKTDNEIESDKSKKSAESKETVEEQEDVSSQSVDNTTEKNIDPVAEEPENNTETIQTNEETPIEETPEIVQGEVEEQDETPVKVQNNPPLATPEELSDIPDAEYREAASKNDADIENDFSENTTSNEEQNVNTAQSKPLPLGENVWEVLNEVKANTEEQLQHAESLNIENKREYITSLLQASITPIQDFVQLSNAEKRDRLNSDIENLTTCLDIIKSDNILSQDIAGIMTIEGVIDLKERQIQLFIQEMREEIEKGQLKLDDPVKQVEDMAIELPEEIETEAIMIFRNMENVEINNESDTITATLDGEEIIKVTSKDVVFDADKLPEDVVKQLNDLKQKIDELNIDTEKTSETQQPETTQEEVQNNTQEHQTSETETKISLLDKMQSDIDEILGGSSNIFITTNDNGEINFRISSDVGVFNVTIDSDNQVHMNEQKLLLKRCFEKLPKEQLREEISKSSKSFNNIEDIKKQLQTIFTDQEVVFSEQPDKKDAIYIHINSTEKSKSKFEYAIKIDDKENIEFIVKNADKKSLSKKDINSIKGLRNKLNNLFNFTNVSELNKLCAIEKTQEKPEKNNTKKPKEKKEHLKPSEKLRELKSSIQDNTITLQAIKEELDDAKSSYKGLLGDFLGFIRNDNSMVENAKAIFDMLKELFQLGLEEYKVKDFLLKALDVLIETPYNAGRKVGELTGAEKKIENLREKLDELKKEKQQERQETKEEKKSKKESSKEETKEEAKKDTKDNPKKETKKDSKDTKKEDEKEKSSKQEQKIDDVLKQPKKTKSNQAILSTLNEKINSFNLQLAKTVANIYGLSSSNGQSKDATKLNYTRNPRYSNEITISGYTDKASKLSLTFSYETGKLTKCKIDDQEVTPPLLNDIQAKSEQISKLFALHDVQTGLAISQNTLQNLSSTIEEQTKFKLDHAIIDIKLGEELSETGIQKNNTAYIEIQNMFDSQNPDKPLTMLISENGEIVIGNKDFDLQSTIKDFIETNKDSLFKAIKTEVQRGWRGINSVKEYEKKVSEHSKKVPSITQEASEMVADAQQQTIDQRMDEVIQISKKIVEDFFKGIDLSQSVDRDVTAEFFKLEDLIKEGNRNGTLPILSEKGYNPGILEIKPHVYIEETADNKRYIRPSCTVKIGPDILFEPRCDSRQMSFNSRQDVYSRYDKVLKEVQRNTKEKEQEHAKTNRTTQDMQNR